MRIDLAKLADLIPQSYIREGIEKLNADFSLNIEDYRDDFAGSTRVIDEQIKLFV